MACCVIALLPSPSHAKRWTSSANTLAGCQLLPKNSPWNQRVDRLPLHPKSATWIRTQKARRLNITPGANRYGQWGLPVNYVSKTQPGIHIPKTLYTIMPGRYPIPKNPVIQGPTDSHMIILQRGTCQLYELWRAKRVSDGWHAGSAMIWNTRRNDILPDGETSANAAGLPMLPGLYNHRDARKKEIRHALYFILPQIQRGFMAPASHTDGVMGANYIPMGARIRLKKSVDISRFGPQSRILARAMQRYGLILADTSGVPHGQDDPLSPNAYSGFGITSETAAHWDDADRLTMNNRLKFSDFEVVDTGATVKQMP